MARVLIVEDSHIYRKLLCDRVSEIEGFAVEAVGMLDSALQMIRDCFYDLIILDLFLPDSKADATVAEVKMIAPRSAICVLTGVSDEWLTAKCIQRNAMEVFIKGTDDLNWKAFGLRLRNAIQVNEIKQNAKKIAREELGIELEAQVQQTIDESKRLIEQSKKLIDGTDYEQ